MYSGKDNTKSVGLPHSDISGSKPILGSPKLFAEYHVFHRLLLPRHPPDALFLLDSSMRMWNPKKSHTSYGPFASPIRLKVFTLNSLFFLSTRFWNTLLYSQMQILLKDLIYWFSSIYSYISYLQNLTTPWIFFKELLSFLTASCVTDAFGGGKEARTPDP